ncbi:hypothetical protein V6N13_066317 [Hibiscus sabdariffa]|uniref:PH domain-containing protein n=1 Tax=Hibiscus sabdariffa TaxID=183260 RepID=A0ABR2DQ36_9ROSI
MENLWRAATGQDPNPDNYKGVEFWANPERAGWLTKQGDYIKTWRRRWFILKQGKLLWFKDPASVSRRSAPRGVVSVGQCLTVKGAEDIVNKAFAFELSTRDSTMYFIADTEKEKEDWINSIGRSIVQHSRSVTDSEVVDYDSKSRLPTNPKVERRVALLPASGFHFLSTARSSPCRQAKLKLKQ